MRKSRITFSVWKSAQREEWKCHIKSKVLVKLKGLVYCESRACIFVLPKIFKTFPFPVIVKLYATHLCHIL